MSAKARYAVRPSSKSPLSYCRQNLLHHFALRLRALRAFAVQTHAHVACVHVAAADDEHGMDARFFSFGDLGFDRVRAEVALDAHLFGAELLDDFLRVSHQALLVVQRQHAHLFGREPEREVAVVVLNEEADEALVRAERL
jgi:hypothetical protein